MSEFSNLKRRFNQRINEAWFFKELTLKNSGFHLLIELDDHAERIFAASVWCLCVGHGKGQRWGGVSQVPVCVSSGVLCGLHPRPEACGKCLEQDRGTQIGDSAPIAGSRLSMDLPPARLESTTVSRQGNDMQKQMDELKEMVKMLQTTIMGAQHDSAVFEQSTTENNGPSGSSGTALQNSSERPLNKTQASILASIRALPVSKQEMDIWRSRGDLPRFNGDPTRWFVFFSTYTETTVQCGFSVSESLRRVKNAIVDPAKRRVQLFLEMPHRLDEIMQTESHTVRRRSPSQQATHG